MRTEEHELTFGAFTVGTVKEAIRLYFDPLRAVPAWILERVYYLWILSNIKRHLEELRKIQESLEEILGEQGQETEKPPKQRTRTLRFLEKSQGIRDEFVRERLKLMLALIGEKDLNSRVEPAPLLRSNQALPSEWQEDSVYPTDLEREPIISEDRESQMRAVIILEKLLQLRPDEVPEKVLENLSHTSSLNHWLWLETKKVQTLRRWVLEGNTPRLLEWVHFESERVAEHVRRIYEELILTKTVERTRTEKKN